VAKVRRSMSQLVLGQIQDMFPKPKGRRKDTLSITDRRGGYVLKIQLMSRVAMNLSTTQYDGTVSIGRLELASTGWIYARRTMLD